MNASDHANVRELATEILFKVDTRKSYADRLLDHSLRSEALSGRDRALLTELTYGTLRWRGRLDRALKSCLRRPLEDTDPFLRNLLRLALYQLMFLDRIPPYAVLDEAGESATNRAGKKASGFVNAVLRCYLRQKEPLTKPDLEKSPLGEFAEYWSHPSWLVDRWLKYFDRGEIEALLAANNRQPALVCRTNARKTTRDNLLALFGAQGIEASPAPWAPQAIRIDSRLALAQLPGFENGLFQVQSEASQLVAYLVDPKPGERVLDACAAPGGKTTQLAELMEDRGTIDAADISAGGVARIEENSRRLGLSSIRVIQADLTQDSPERFGRPYDRILVDAPCSGLGTLRSHPEIKWNRNEKDIERLSRLQKQILARLAVYLRSGGVLVYSTCTLTDTENENVVADFLRQHGEFVLDEASGYLPPEARSMVRGKYFMALPHRHDTDGFFAARLRKVA